MLTSTTSFLVSHRVWLPTSYFYESFKCTTNEGIPQGLLGKYYLIKYYLLNSFFGFFLWGLSVIKFYGWIEYHSKNMIDQETWKIAKHNFFPTSLCSSLCVHHLRFIQLLARNQRRKSQRCWKWLGKCLIIVFRVLFGFGVRVEKIFFSNQDGLFIVSTLQQVWSLRN